MVMVKMRMTASAEEPQRNGKRVSKGFQKGFKATQDDHRRRLVQLCFRSASCKALSQVSTHINHSCDEDENLVSPESSSDCSEDVQRRIS